MYIWEESNIWVWVFIYKFNWEESNRSWLKYKNNSCNYSKILLLLNLIRPVFPASTQLYIVISKISSVLVWKCWTNNVWLHFYHSLSVTTRSTNYGYWVSVYLFLSLLCVLFYSSLPNFFSYLFWKYHKILVYKIIHDETHI